jgi:hypothetical protein
MLSDIRKYSSDARKCFLISDDFFPISDEFFPISDEFFPRNSSPAKDSLCLVPGDCKEMWQKRINERDEEMINSKNQGHVNTQHPYGEFTCIILCSKLPQPSTIKTFVAREFTFSLARIHKCSDGQIEIISW